jgi:hypothetical protein
VTLIDASQIARGLAYRSYRHYLLNVPAGLIVGETGRTLEFIDLARHRLPGVDAGGLPARELCSEYLEWALRQAEHFCPAHVELQRLHGVVVALERIRCTPATSSAWPMVACYALMTSSLALGNPPPAPLPVHEGLRGSARYVDDPWRSPPPFRPGRAS